MPSEVLIIFMITSSVGFSLAVLRIIYKYQYNSLKCCGCLKIERDIEVGEHIENRNVTSLRSDATTTKTNSITL